IDQAIAFFTGVIHAKNDDPLPYVLRARVWEAKNELDIALRDLDDALRLDPTHAWAYNWRGILWRHKHAYDKAIADHTLAINLEPNDFHSYVNRALVFMDMNDFDKAIDDLNQANRFDPENSKLFNKRGWAWYCKDEFDKAIGDYTQAISLDAQIEETYVNRGMAWFAKQEYDKAIADYDHALKLDPSDAYAYNDRGWAWESKQEHDKAIADFDMALKCRPPFVRALTNRGIARVAKKEFQKALDDYNQALEIDPARERSLTYRGIALTVLGKYDRAIADFDAALKAAPTAIWPRYNRLVAYLSAGRPEALAEARKLLQQVGWNHELAIHTALLGHYSAIRSGQIAESQQFLKDAAAHGNTRQWSYQVVRFLRGEIQEPELLGSATRPDQQTEAHSFLGLHDSLTGHPDKALSHFRWVKQNGQTSNAGYELSSAELDRIENQNQSRASRGSGAPLDFIGQRGPQAQARFRRLN
ncbi:MAG: tetratricopeptide repeat protein, partial [Isosphaeraceae bacterium]